MRVRAALLCLVLAAIPAPALAHGLLMKLRAEQAAIVGELYYSNGQRAGGEWIELYDEAGPAEALQTVQTKEDGTFRLPGTHGHRYRVRASGEEGHEIVMTIALSEQARGKMVDEGKARSEGVPAWAILGGALLLSVIPALVLRRRGKPAGD